MTVRRRGTALRLGRALAAGAVLIVAGVGSGGDARGADATATVTGPRAAGGPTVAPGVQTGPDRLLLLGQTTTVGPGGAWQIHLQVHVRDPSTAEVRLVAYSRLTTRTDFDNTLKGRESGSVVWHTTYLPVSSLPADTGGGVTLTIPVDQDQTGSDLPRFNPVAQSGVFPLQVELYEGTASAVATLDTSLVFAAGSAAQTDFPKLDVALTLGLHAPVVAPRRAAPGVTATVPELAASAGRLPVGATTALATEVRELGRHPTVPVNLAVTPETVDALVATGATGRSTGSSGGAAAARATVSTLAGLARSGDELLPSTYVSTSLPALQAGGLASETAIQVAAGSAALGDDLHQAPGRSTWVVDGPLDTATLSTLRHLGFTHLVVPAAALTALPPALQGTTFAAPTALSTPTGRLTVQAADGGLGSHFTRGGDQVLAGQQLLAELAMVQLESPAQQRAVAVLPPPSWTPTTSFLDTVLGGLQADPLLQAVTVDRLFTAVPVKSTTTGPVVRQLVAARPTAAPLSSAAAILEARARIAGYLTVVPGAATAAGGLANRLLLAESSDVDPVLRARLTGGVLAAINAVRTMISLPGSASITLTARKGSLPLTILSAAPFHAHVELRLSSDKLSFEPFTPPGGSCTRPSTTTETCQLVLTTAVDTIKVPVETRTSGVFSLQVVLSSPDGSLPLGSDRDTVRSTAVSGVGVVLIVLAFLGLAYWWIRNIRHGRRARQLIEPDAASGEADGPPGPAPLPDPGSPRPAVTTPAVPADEVRARAAAPDNPAGAGPDREVEGPGVTDPAGPATPPGPVDDDDLFAEFFSTPAPQYPRPRSPGPVEQPEPRRG